MAFSVKIYKTVKIHRFIINSLPLLKYMHLLLKEPLTVDVDIAADVCAAKRVGNLAGNRFCKEGVVHNNLICVSRNLLDYTSSFGPPGERIRKAEKGETVRNGQMKEKGKRH